MHYFKDKNNNIHAPEVENGKRFLEEYHPLLKPFVEIDQAEFDLLTTPTTQQVNDSKDALVESEFSGGKTHALVETFLEIINDGSVSTDTANDVILKAKAKRFSEL